METFVRYSIFFVAGAFATVLFYLGLVRSWAKRSVSLSPKDEFFNCPEHGLIRKDQMFDFKLGDEYVTDRGLMSSFLQCPFCLENKMLGAESKLKLK